MIRNKVQQLRTPAQSGFTLIELIVVIVILGILAATALPRFANLGGDARAATLRAAMGSLQSVSAMGHGHWLAHQGDPAGNVLSAEGVNITMASGYPDAIATTADAAGLGAADYTVIANAAGAAATATTPAIPVNGMVIIPAGVAGTAQAVTCFVSYTRAADTTHPPAIALDVAGC